MYNPGGAVLPPAQAGLEADYRRELEARAGVRFNHLLVLANMPIQRFGSTLVSHGGFDDYMRLLQASHRRENLDAVMCRSLISVDWRGYVYDCDFNQMLGLDIGFGARRKCRLEQLRDVDLTGMQVRVAGHCYGCTAGQGSSCGGAVGSTG
jgi:radical SAM/Cys-rich protein